jgi:hypothetical protein
LRVGEAGDGAGDAAGFIADEGHSGNDVALVVEVHVAAGGGGGLFAVVEEVGLESMGAMFAADEHEAAAADVSCGRVDHGEGESDGDGCVDGVAALLEDGEACVGGVVLDGDDHGVFGADRLGVRLGGCRLRERDRRSEERGEQRGGAEGVEAVGQGLPEHGSISALDVGDLCRIYRD